jgi:hypothetical protein
MPRVGDDDSNVYTDGGERCAEPDSLGSLRDFIDDSEGQSCWQRFETTAVVLILT